MAREGEAPRDFIRTVISFCLVPPPKGTTTTWHFVTFRLFEISPSPCVFPLKCDKINMFFDRGVMP